jgi:phenylacetic acid degradation protein
MNAVVMDEAVVGTCSIVGASAFVKAGMIIPPRSMVLGAPAKVVRELKDQEIAWKSMGTGQYQLLTERCLATMQCVDPLSEVEPDRKKLNLQSPAKPKIHSM